MLLQLSCVLQSRASVSPQKIRRVVRGPITHILVLLDSSALLSASSDFYTCINVFCGGLIPSTFSFSSIFTSGILSVTESSQSAKHKPGELLRIPCLPSLPVSTGCLSPYHLPSSLFPLTPTSDPYGSSPPSWDPFLIGHAPPVYHHAAFQGFSILFRSLPCLESSSG